MNPLKTEQDFIAHEGQVVYAYIVECAQQPFCMRKEGTLQVWRRERLTPALRRRGYGLISEMAITGLNSPFSIHNNRMDRDGGIHFHLGRNECVIRLFSTENEREAWIAGEAVRIQREKASLVTAVRRMAAERSNNQ